MFEEAEERGAGGFLVLMSETCKEASEGREAVDANYLPLLSSMSESLVLHPEARRVEVDRLGDVFARQDDVVQSFDGERRHFWGKFVLGFSRW